MISSRWHPPVSVHASVFRSTTSHPPKRKQASAARAAPLRQDALDVRVAELLSLTQEECDALAAVAQNRAVPGR
jgi:hypothetical protein